MSDWKSSFTSVLAHYIIAFIEEKRKIGYKYITEFRHLRNLDQFLVERNLRKIELPQNLVETWVKRKKTQTHRTQQIRIICIRNFAKYLLAQGKYAYYPEIYATEKSTSSFKPYIFSHEEIQSLFTMADAMSQELVRGCYASYFHVVIRLLYTTGCRAGEIAALRWRDIDLANGVLKIYDAKYRKDRFVPLAPGMTAYLKRYAERQIEYSPDTYVFRGWWQNNPSASSFYLCFRKLLFRCGISHSGRGKGPRLHDLRHTFAVHNLERWLKAKMNPMEKLPILADYLGHQSISSTQYYLRLIPSIHEELVVRMENAIGSKITVRGEFNETD